MAFPFNQFAAAAALSVQDACTLLRSPAPNPLSMKNEGDEKNPHLSHVTAKDLNASRLICARLGTIPELLVVSEEDSATFPHIAHCGPGSNRYVSLVDPNDGSLNLAIGCVEHTASAIGLVCNGEPVAGFIGLTGQQAGIRHLDGRFTGWDCFGAMLFALDGVAYLAPLYPADQWQAGMGRLPFSGDQNLVAEFDWGGKKFLACRIPAPAPVGPDAGKRAIIFADPNNPYVCGLAKAFDRQFNVDGVSVTMLYTNVMAQCMVALNRGGAAVFGQALYGDAISGPKIWDWAATWAVFKALGLGYYDLATGEEISTCSPDLFTEKGVMKVNVVATHPSLADDYVQLFRANMEWARGGVSIRRRL